MGVLQKDEFFDKLNTTRELEFQYHILNCCNNDFFYSHKIIKMKRSWNLGSSIKANIMWTFLDQMDENTKNKVNMWLISNCILLANKNNFASNWDGGIKFI
jgi:hypothetical protein